MKNLTGPLIATRRGATSGCVALDCPAPMARSATRGRPPRAGTPAPLDALLELLVTWQERAEQRHCLAQLDDRLLRDVGLDRLDAAREAAKPFWRR